MPEDCDNGSCDICFGPHDEIDEDEQDWDGDDEE